MVAIRNTSMMRDEEQELHQALLDARALVVQLERELREANERVADAEAALAEHYSNSQGRPRREPVVDVWLTGIAGGLLQQATDIEGDAREAIDTMYVRGMGFGSRTKLTARSSVAIEIASWLENEAFKMRQIKTKKARTDAASLNKSAATIREQVHSAGGD